MFCQKKGNFVLRQINYHKITINKVKNGLGYNHKVWQKHGGC